MIQLVVYTMLHMKTKHSVDNFQELSFHSMHNVGEIVEHQHASKTNVYVHNYSVLMHPVAIVLHTDLLLRDQHVVMDR